MWLAASRQRHFVHRCCQALIIYLLLKMKRRLRDSRIRPDDKVKGEAVRPKRVSSTTAAIHNSTVMSDSRGRQRSKGSLMLRRRRYNWMMSKTASNESGG
mmetsp:Transcript_1655/g.2242  ORF Transcript_1655/g.2242 Transcript_1655/m.2242 type:complete len:100 (-) Transcript_1655:111-410(-)